ncbi:MAG TPA: sugar nucleotide-binding protein [Planctomycetaceae bacterium]|nr:sugar nucleotide-binding protein [Planctomycetaceae bacterium]
MEQILIGGIDSVVGANVAAHLAESFRVIGATSTSPVSIEGCETIVTADDAQAIRQAATRHRPERIVLCQAAGDSAWHRVGGWIASPAAIESARTWTRTASELGIPVTLLSSDAVFTGPWMFHGETSDSLCSSIQARSLRTLENSTLEQAPKSLVVRTHAYGWSPVTDGSGWIEGIVAALESEEPGIFDCAAHATPILATDLAEILPLCWGASLSGIYHIAGAERVSPHRFVCALARIFDLAAPKGSTLAPAESAAAAFGQGETSLRTRAVQRAVGRPMPMLVEGLERLLEQKNGGFDRRFRGSRRLATSKVA